MPVLSSGDSDTVYLIGGRSHFGTLVGPDADLVGGAFGSLFVPAADPFFGQIAAYHPGRGQEVKGTYRTGEMGKLHLFRFELFSMGK